MVLAARGLREEDAGQAHPVDDPTMRRTLWRQAIQIAWKAALGAALLTAAAMVP
jgi:hypothetical protein